MKKLDQYIIKTFLGPFLFIFSVLFFIFIVNIIWIKLSQFTDKGLSPYEVAKLLFYMSATVVSMVLPLTILLSSIMTFGSFGERYELAAMKAAGISLFRVMRPLILISTVLATILFVFSNNIVPNFNRKAKNMLYNIVVTKPALNFTPGQFINTIPGASAKFDKIYGENGEFIEGVIIHKETYGLDNLQTIVAKKGQFVPAKNKNYLKLTLNNGYIFEDENKSYDYNERLRQPNRSIKFDSLTLHLDVSAVVNKAIEEEKISDSYEFQTYPEITKTIGTISKNNQEIIENINTDLIMQNSYYLSQKEEKNQQSNTRPPLQINQLKKDQQLNILYKAYNKINTLKEAKKTKDEELYDLTKYYSNVVMYQQRILAFPFTCIIFFLIGASLGSIIRKGGIGLPVVISIFVFVIFYVLNLSVENLSWKGKLNPYLAAWLPNIVLAPFGVWLTIKALTDSQVFDIEKYKTLLRPITKLLYKNKEHQRYQ